MGTSGIRIKSVAKQQADEILGGNRRALARAITLIESDRNDHRASAGQLLEKLLPYTGRATRIGISGSPGVGKSTFIEAFGLYLLSIGKQLAVLAVDPSSTVSGGSIMGDKTRMEFLARNPNVYIRPTPAAGALGGIARHTREAMLLCEAAGFDVLLVETVGVGQSESDVAMLVDLFLLLVQPGGGDDLQGIKRGVMELADLIIVNKTDGRLKDLALETVSDYKSALALLSSRTSQELETRVFPCSALESSGLLEIWKAIEIYKDMLADTGELATNRGDQAISWMWREISDQMLGAIKTNKNISSRAKTLELKVRNGERTPMSAAIDILNLVNKNNENR